MKSFPNLTAVGFMHLHQRIYAGLYLGRGRLSKTPAELHRGGGGEYPPVIYTLLLHLRTKMKIISNYILL